MYVGYTSETTVADKQSVIVKPKSAQFVYLEIMHRPFRFADEQYLADLTVYHY